MASFPTTVYAPASVSAGQVIQAADINNPNAEIAAIETALINGPLTLASVATLNVTGGSTFASRPIIPLPEAVKVGLNAKVDLATASTQVIAWSTAVFKTNSSMHSTIANSDRLVPQSTGIFSITAQIWLTNRMAVAASTCAVFVQIEDSSGGVIAQMINADPGAPAPFYSPAASATGLKYFDVLNGNQWARVVVVQNSGSTNSVDSTKTFAHMFKVY